MTITTDPKLFNILGIESSCDDTGVAIYSPHHGIRAEALFSQTKIHQRYGGVVPELASRDHLQKILPLIECVLNDAGLMPRDINAIAYTAGPGLVGALLVGATVAKSLAFAWEIPAIAVHHLEGHLLIPMLTQPTLQTPFLSLLVSGGHSQFVLANGDGDYTILGETIDDAAGEAFDKTAKLLGLPANPGGPHIEKLAKQGRAGQFHFPRPLLNRPGFDFSFSGLKTAVRTAFQQSDQSEQVKADIARAFQEAVIETLVIKSQRVLQHTGLNQFVIAGGVGANTHLREQLVKLLPTSVQVFFTPLAHCTDNGAMIAYAGYQRWQRGIVDHDLKINVKARWSL